MIIKNAVEEIHQIFPHTMETQIIKDLDIAQKEFIDETNYLETYFSLNSIATNTSWLLPIFFNHLIDVRFYDINNNPLYKEDYQIDYEIQYGNLYFLSVGATPLGTGIPVGISYILVGFNQKPDTLSSINSIFQVNDEHIPGVIARVYEKYYSRFPVDMTLKTATAKIGETIHTRDFNAVKYWMQKNLYYRQSAKRWINRKNDSSDGRVVNYGMAGRFVLPLRNMPAISGTMQPISVLQDLYSKWFKFTSIGGIAVIDGNSFGFTSLPSVLFNNTNNTFTITSADNEFTNTMNYESNNKDNHIWGWNAANIEVNFGDASGTLTLTIWEDKL